MQEILEGYDSVFSDWSNQRLKINDIEREILYLQADLNAEKEANSFAVKNETEKARIELEDAEAIVKRLESGLEMRKANDSCLVSKQMEDRQREDVETDLAVSLEKELADARYTLQSCREYYDFVTRTYEEQTKLWEIGYRGYSLRIDNLKERLKIEEALLASYAKELEEWKEKLNSVFQHVI